MIRREIWHSDLSFERIARVEERQSARRTRESAINKSGGVSVRVFKLKTVELAEGAVERIRKRQSIANFTTRTHYPGRHEIEILINGQVHGRAAFELPPQ